RAALPAPEPARGAGAARRPPARGRRATGGTARDPAHQGVEAPAAGGQAPARGAQADAPAAGRRLSPEFAHGSGDPVPVPVPSRLGSAHAPSSPRPRLLGPVPLEARHGARSAAPLRDRRR